MKCRCASSAFLHEHIEGGLIRFNVGNTVYEIPDPKAVPVPPPTPCTPPCVCASKKS